MATPTTAPQVTPAQQTAPNPATTDTETTAPFNRAAEQKTALPSSTQAAEEEIDKAFNAFQARPAQSAQPETPTTPHVQGTDLGTNPTPQAAPQQNQQVALDLTAVPSRSSQAAEVVTQATDTSNDGKFSFWQATKNFFGGVVKSFASAFWPMENLKTTALVTIGVAAAGFFAPVAVGGILVAAGVGLVATKLFQAGKLSYEAYQSGNGDLAEEAFGKVGEAVPGMIPIAGRVGMFPKITAFFSNSRPVQAVANSKFGQFVGDSRFASGLRSSAKGAAYVTSKTPGYDTATGIATKITPGVIAAAKIPGAAQGAANAVAFSATAHNAASSAQKTYDEMLNSASEVPEQEQE